MAESDKATISPNFHADDADIIACSAPLSDGRRIQFKLHCAQLRAASTVFADMCAIGSNGGTADSGVQTVTLEESAETLETFFPFFYPDESKYPALRHKSVDDLVAVFRCANKYDFPLLVQFVEEAFE